MKSGLDWINRITAMARDYFERERISDAGRAEGRIKQSENGAAHNKQAGGHLNMGRPAGTLTHAFLLRQMR
ncbi:hypothetical protein [Aquaspirillum sp. LM1]|uniref:hypothetical protein n=1 Tax=Aquaspirillum sp. LM1 TaxID=1938604 RepID=UPI00123738E2|nr:hypothetical protein [Aquaspirillum sp. LM1]